MTSYVIHHSDNNVVVSRIVDLNSTSAYVTTVSSGHSYTFSTEATSQHLSGVSSSMNITVGELHCIVTDCCHLAV